MSAARPVDSITTELRTIADLPRFDGFDRHDFGADFDWIADDLFRREYQGLLQHETHGVIVYRNDDLWALGTHPQVSHHSELSGVWDESVVAHQRFMAASTFSMQPPVHQPGKSIISKRLASVSMKRYMNFAADVVEELIRDSLQRDKTDFVHDFIKPLLARLWCHVLGLSSGEAARITELMNDFFRPFLLEPTEEDLAVANDASEEFVDLITDALTREMSNGRHAILNELARDYAEMGEVGRPKNICTHFGVALPDGFNTLGSMTANTLYTLLSNSAALAQVKADPDLVPEAWLEGQRLNPVVVATQRETLADIQHGGVVLPKGTQLSMLWAFGNRDPEVFEDPNAYQLHRASRGKQTTFGGGFYACPGRPSARLLGEVVLRALTAPGIDVTVLDGFVWATRSLAHEPEHMTLAIRNV